MSAKSTRNSLANSLNYVSFGDENGNIRPPKHESLSLRGLGCFHLCKKWKVTSSIFSDTKNRWFYNPDNSISLNSSRVQGDQPLLSANG